jgi:hypothetical protein
VIANAKKWAKANRVRVRANENKRLMEVKIDVLSHYGKDGKLQCCWPGCEVNDIDVLTLDHVNDDGAQDRMSHKRLGKVFYDMLKGQNYPSGLQTLCANHNLKKEILRRRVSIL